MTLLASSYFAGKFYDIRNSFCYHFCHKHFLASIVLQLWTYVPSGYSVFYPCCTLRLFFMCNFFVPGGAMGVALKSNCLKICKYADNLGFVINVLNKLIVISNCLTILHHKYIGKLLSTDSNPDTKLFLKLRIAHSTEFLL